MQTKAAERNLLLGFLALQLDFISREQFLAGMNVWVGKKSVALADILEQQGALAPGVRPLLDGLVEKHLEQHGGDPERSLASLKTIGSVRQELENLGDHAVERSLSLVPAEDVDPLVTTAFVEQGSNAGSRFRILRPHAKGGLGEVFVAEDCEVHREVALKCIQSRFADDPTSRSRFLLEAEVTGSLEHPGIVPVYSVGRYAEGRPFYAMRFIRGDSLKDGIRKFFAELQPAKATANAHADDGIIPNKRNLALPASAYESLAFRRLLGRFIDVCNAIAYAHSRGVLHRDLKPGNIMLGKFGETLVVDWGLSKTTGLSGDSSELSQAPLSRASDSQSAETQQGSVIGTPGYMSPEQAAGRVDLFSTATDIYCLGATLYHVLTGRAPHQSLEADPGYRRIQTGEFPRPRELNQKIPAALESICQKAMATKPADRYPTALAFVADLEHWLADEAVSAHNDSLLARAQRFARRNRTLVTTAVALLIAASLGITISYFALRAEQSRTLLAKQDADEKRVAAQKNFADAQQQRTQAETNFQLAMDAVQKMLYEVGNSKLEDVPQMEGVRKKLLQEAETFYQKLLQQKSTDANVRERTGKSHWALADYCNRGRDHARAETAYRNAITIFEQLVKDFPNEPRYRVDLAATYSNLSVLLSGLPDREHDEEDMIHKALAIRTGLMEENPESPRYRSAMAYSHQVYGNFLAGRGQRQEAENQFFQSVVLHRKLADEFPSNREYRSVQAQSLRSMAFLLKKEQPEESEKCYRESLDLMEDLCQRYPEDANLRQELAKNYGQLGMLHREQDNHELAILEFEKAHEIYHKLAEDYPTWPAYWDGPGYLQRQSGSSCRELKRYAEAEREHRRAAAVWKQALEKFSQFPKYHWELGTDLYQAGRCARLQGNRNTARELFEQAISELSVKLPKLPRGPDEYRSQLRYAQEALVETFAELGDAAAAVQAARAIPAMFGEGLKSHTRAAECLVDCLSLLAKVDSLTPAVRLQIGDQLTTAAFELLVEAEAQPEFQQPTSLSALAQAWRQDIADPLRDQGQHEKALLAFAHSRRIFESLVANFPAEPAHQKALALTWHEEASSLKSLGRQQLAHEAYTKARELSLVLTQQHPEVLEHQKALSFCYYNHSILLSELEKKEEAQQFAEQGLAIREQLLARKPDDRYFAAAVADSCLQVADFLENAGSFDEAEIHLRRALQIRQDRADTTKDLDDLWNAGWAFNNMANYLHRVGRLEEAEALFQQALAARIKLVEEFPTRPNYLSELAITQSHMGTLYMDWGKVAEARTAYEQSLAGFQRLTADYPQVLSYRIGIPYRQQTLAAWHHRAGEFAQAQQLFADAGRQFVKLAAEFPQRADYPKAALNAQYFWLKSFAAAGNWKEADERYRKLAEQHHSNDHLQNSYAWHLVSCKNRDFRNPQRALEVALKGTELNPKNENLWNTLGMIYYRLDKWPESVAAIQKSQQLRPIESAEDWLILAMSQQKLGAFSAASAAFERGKKWVLTHKPGDPELNELLREAAECLERSNDQSFRQPQYHFPAAAISFAANSRG